MSSKCPCGVPATLPCGKCKAVSYCSSKCSKGKREHHKNDCAINLHPVPLKSPEAYKVYCLCGKLAGPKCSRCESVSYCSRKCQVKDWTEHKKICSPSIPATPEMLKLSEIKGYNTLERTKDTIDRTLRKVFSDKDVDVNSLSRHQRIVAKRCGAITSLEEKLRSAETSCRELYFETLSKFINLIDGKVDGFISDIKTRAGSRGTAFANILIYGRDIRTDLSGYCKLYFTCILFVTGRNKNAIYGSMSNDVDGVHNYCSENNNGEFVTDKDNIFWGTPGKFKAMIKVKDGSEIYHVVSPNSGRTLGVRGLPDEAFDVSMVNKVSACCGTGRMIACYCLKYLYCSRDCPNMFEEHHTKEECLEAAKDTNPNLLH